MNYQEQDQPNIIETLRRIRVSFSRYWKLAWPPACAVIILALVISVKLPSYYSASFTIFIQPQQISTSLISQAERKQENEQFDALIQELLSRTRILTIIQRFDLYPYYKGLQGQERALKRFQTAYKIETIQSLLGGKSENSAPTFKVTFSHVDKSKVYQVADELQNVFVQESLINQRGEIRGTEEFLMARLKSTQQKLEQIEQKRRQYVRNNAGKMPERRERAVLEQRESHNKFAANSQLIAANQGRVRYLEQELEMTMRDPSTSQVASGSGSAVAVDPEAGLAQQRRNLALLLSRYSEKHPDVLATKNQIAALEEKVKKGGGSGKTSGGSGAMSNTRESRMISREISELEVQTKILQEENITLQNKIAELDKEIQSIPIKEQELIEIERDYATQKSIYDKLVFDREEASIKASLIQSQKGSRFRIIESPAKPELPAGPPRLIIAGAGILVGVMLFLAIPLAFYFLNSAFKFKKEAEDLIGLPILGVIPPLKTPGVLSASRKAQFTSFVSSAFTVVVGVVLILIMV